MTVEVGVGATQPPAELEGLGEVGAADWAPPASVEAVGDRAPHETILSGGVWVGVDVL